MRDNAKGGALTEVTFFILLSPVSYTPLIIGGYVVLQSIFRISINDKIQSYGQLRTIGTTPKQLRRIVKKEGRFLGLSLIHI